MGFGLRGGFECGVEDGWEDQVWVKGKGIWCLDFSGLEVIVMVIGRLGGGYKVAGFLGLVGGNCNGDWKIGAWVDRDKLNR